MHACIDMNFKGSSPEGRYEVDKWIRTNLTDDRIANGKLREKVISIVLLWRM